MMSLFAVDRVDLAFKVTKHVCSSLFAISVLQMVCSFLYDNIKQYDVLHYSGAYICMDIIS
jgi:hypothetical protein